VRAARAAGVPILQLDASADDTDVHERLNDLEARLLFARRLEVVGRLVGGVAHDFNNVLSVVTTLSELLLRFGPDDDPAREDLQEINDAARRGSELTRQLQAFARADAGDAEPVELGERLLGAEKLIRKLLPEDIAIVVQVGDGVPPAWLDPVEVDQIVFNLAAHGRWALRGGGSLRLAAEESAGGRPRVVLDLAPRVRSGAPSGLEAPGAPAEPGPGLVLPGLAGIEEIIARRDGRLIVSEADDGASRVEVELARAPSTDLGVAEAPAWEGEGRRILLVEDEEAVRAALGRLLRAFGCEVEAVETGGQALTALQSEPPDAVVCDAVLSDAWGSELLTRARAGGFAGPFLFVSGHEDHPAVGEARRGGGVMIRKPVSGAALADALARLLQTDDG
jgi:CheY-like chemotaxis protein